MMLFLVGLSTGAVYAASDPNTEDVRITQQSGVCTGVVIDATGETVIGASVLVKGTTNGTITDIDGKFILSNINRFAIPSNFLSNITYERNLKNVTR